MKRLIFFLALLIHSLGTAKCFRFGIDDLDPNALIEKAVNATTGEYLESVTDMIVRAPDPLIIQRHYSSGAANTDPEGWMLSCALTLLVGKEGPSFCAFAALPSGTILPFNQRVRDWVPQPLPVVAIGSIPYIYRRASLMHRATPTYLPLD